MYETTPWVLFLFWEFWLRGPMIEEEGLNLGLLTYYVFLFLCKWESEVWLDFVFGHLVHKGFKPGFACLICASFLVQMRIRSLIEFCFWSLMLHKSCKCWLAQYFVGVGLWMKAISELFFLFLFFWESRLAHLCQCGSLYVFF